MAPLNDATPEQLVARVNRFRSLPAELPWIEFKVNSATSGPEIARYISALGNSATLNDETAAYLVWGINDDRQIVGTSFSWQTAKGKGNEDLLPWLSRAIIPTPQLKFLDVEIEGKLVTMLRIAAPHEAPFAYEGQRHFRQGSYTKPLLNYPKVERDLWQKLSQFEAETSLVAEGLTAAEVVDHLSAEAFFANRPEVPHISGTALADLFKEHGAVSYTHELGWCIPAWSALMYAHRLSDFTQLRNLGPPRIAVQRYEPHNHQTRMELRRGLRPFFPQSNGAIRHSAPRRRVNRRIGTPRGYPRATAHRLSRGPGQCSHAPKP